MAKDKDKDDSPEVEYSDSVLDEEAINDEMNSALSDLLPEDTNIRDIFTTDTGKADLTIKPDNKAEYSRLSRSWAAIAADVIMGANTADLARRYNTDYRIMLRLVKSAQFKRLTERVSKQLLKDVGVRLTTKISNQIEKSLVAIVKIRDDKDDNGEYKHPRLSFDACKYIVDMGNRMMEINANEEKLEELEDRLKEIVSANTIDVTSKDKLAKLNQEQLLKERKQESIIEGITQYLKDSEDFKD